MSLIGDSKNSLQVLGIRTGSVGKDNLAIENGECGVTLTSLEYQLKKYAVLQSLPEKFDRNHCIRVVHVSQASFYCYSILES